MTLLTVLDFASVEDLVLAVEQDGQRTDAHRAKAAEIFGMPYETVTDAITDEQRRVGKLDNFKELYGAQSMAVRGRRP